MMTKKKLTLRLVASLLALLMLAVVPIAPASAGLTAEAPEPADEPGPWIETAGTLCAEDAGTDCCPFSGPGSDHTCWAFGLFVCNIPADSSVPILCNPGCPPGLPPDNYWCRLVLFLLFGTSGSEEDVPLPFTLSGVSEDDGGPYDPEECKFQFGFPYPDALEIVLQPLRSNCVTVWILVWYFPPGVYQALCIAIQFCPIPPPSLEDLASAESSWLAAGTETSEGTDDDPYDPGMCRFEYAFAPWAEIVFAPARANCVTAWILVWYFPPGVYQALCIAIQFCPIPPPSGPPAELEDLSTSAATAQDSGQLYACPPSTTVDQQVCWFEGAVSCTMTGGMYCDPGCPPATPPDNYWCRLILYLVFHTPPPSAAASHSNDPPTVPTDPGEGGAACNGKIVVQHDLAGNTWTCDGPCAGNIIVQVSLARNEVRCENTCVGNVVIQIGLDDNIFACYLDGVLLEGAEASNFILRLPEGTDPESAAKAIQEYALHMEA